MDLCYLLAIYLWSLEMKPVSKTDTKILDKIFGGLAEGSCKKINNSKVYMFLSAEHISNHLYSMAHYYEHNGELCPDPDIELLKDDQGNWYPKSLQQISNRFYCAIEDWDEHGNPTKVRLKTYNELRRFLSIWLRNLKEQQEL